MIIRDSEYVDGPSPEMHATRVEYAIGSYWAVCSCKALSFPHSTGGEAAQWTCPRAAAEAQIQHARAVWDAHMAALRIDPRI